MSFVINPLTGQWDEVGTSGGGGSNNPGTPVSNVAMPANGSPATVTGLTYSGATYDASLIFYKVVANDDSTLVRTGQLRVANSTTIASLDDSFIDLTSPSLTPFAFSVTVSGGTVQVQYSNQSGHPVTGNFFITKFTT